MYTPLADGEIRLLVLLDTSSSTSSVELKAEIRKYSLSTAPAYAALSYRWKIPAGEISSSFLQKDVKSEHDSDSSTDLGKDIQSKFDAPLSCPLISLSWPELRITTSLEIGYNLFSALHSLQTTHHGHLFWADAICINQEDLHERDRQVGMMQEIFRGAAKVIAWIPRIVDKEEVERLLSMDLSPKRSKADEDLKAKDDAEESEAKEVRSEGYISTSGENQSKTSSENTQTITTSRRNDLGPDPAAWKSFFSLLSDAYWSRIWIQQELVVASQWEAHCPSTSKSSDPLSSIVDSPLKSHLGSSTIIIPGSAIESLQAILTDPEAMPHKYTIKRKFASAIQHLDLGQSPAKSLHVWRELQKQQRGRQHDQAYFRGSLLYCLDKFRACEATLGHDRVYALLGLALDTADIRERHEIPIDYGSNIADCFIEVVKYVMRKYASLEFLCQAYEPYERPEKIESDRREESEKLDPAQRPRYKEDLPSWVPHWELRVIPTLMLTKYSRASGELPFNGTVRGKILKVRGFQVDAITYIQERKETGVGFAQQSDLILQVAKWSNTLRPSQNQDELEYSGIKLSDQLVRTLATTFNTSDEKPLSLDQARKLLTSAMPLQKMHSLMHPSNSRDRNFARRINQLTRTSKREPNGVSTHLKKELMQNYILGGRIYDTLRQEPAYHALRAAQASGDREAIKEAARVYSESETFKRLKQDPEFGSMRKMIYSNVEVVGDDPKLRTFLSSLTRRQMVVMASGSIGLTLPCCILPGDEVWILYGCPTPVVLRRDGEQFVHISPLYADGYMSGETIEGSRGEDVEIR